MLKHVLLLANVFIWSLLHYSSPFHFFMYLSSGLLFTIQCQNQLKAIIRNQEELEGMVTLLHVLSCTKKRISAEWYACYAMLKDLKVKVLRCQCHKERKCNSSVNSRLVTPFHHPTNAFPLSSLIHHHENSCPISFSILKP